MTAAVAPASSVFPHGAQETAALGENATTSLLPTQPAAYTGAAVTALSSSPPSPSDTLGAATMADTSTTPLPPPGPVADASAAAVAATASLSPSCIPLGGEVEAAAAATDTMPPFNRSSAGAGASLPTHCLVAATTATALASPPLSRPGADAEAATATAASAPSPSLLPAAVPIVPPSPLPPLATTASMPPSPPLTPHVTQAAASPLPSSTSAVATTQLAPAPVPTAQLLTVRRRKRILVTLEGYRRHRHALAAGRTAGCDSPEPKRPRVLSLPSITSLPSVGRPSTGWFAGGRRPRDVGTSDAAT